MGMGRLLLGVVVAPLVGTSAFMGLIATNFRVTRASAPAGVFASVSSLPATPGPVCMTVGGEPGEGGGQGAGGSRVQFLRDVSTGVIAAAAGVVAGGWVEGVAPAVADSTGRYSSKATARKRYLPRIAKGVSGFQQLKKDIDSGTATAKAPFFVDQLPDSVSAMDLYGSSMKRGETPDSKSRALQQLAKDFGASCSALAKGLGNKGGEADTAKAYGKASALLAEYLKGAELDPIGSESYNYRSF